MRYFTFFKLGVQNPLCILHVQHISAQINHVSSIQQPYVALGQLRPRVCCTTLLLDMQTPPSAH